MVKHLGVNLRNKEYGLKLTKENYLSNVRESHSALMISSERVVIKGKSTVVTKTYKDLITYSAQDIEKQYRKAGINYDLNIKYFDPLDAGAFENSLEVLIKTLAFTEVDDLNTLADVEGYYLMVVGDYKQVYLGISKDIKKRIMSHWSKTIPLDELISSREEVSTFCIDNFRALDTTRILVETNKDTYNEYLKIAEIPVQYCLNKGYSGFLGVIPTNLSERRREKRILRDFPLSRDLLLMSLEDEINTSERLHPLELLYGSDVVTTLEAELNLLIETFDTLDYYPYLQIGLSLLISEVTQIITENKGKPTLKSLVTKNFEKATIRSIYNVSRE